MLRLKKLKKSIQRNKLELHKLLKLERIPNCREHLYIESTSLCNLSCKFCAYRKKVSPKVTMENELFYDVINHAVNMGYDDFGLTPITGEIFMDKSIFDKLQFLEDHPGVKSYHFFTNLTVINENRLSAIKSLKKLKNFNISLYGHDCESFIAITQSTSKVYSRLINNIKTLVDNDGLNQENIKIGLRTYRYFDFHKNQSDLVDLLKEFKHKQLGRIDIYKKGFNNWGGLISQKDVEGLDLEVVEGNDTIRVGPCALIFYKLQILSDGRVNACACRDVNGTLLIGDLKNNKLNEIISPHNPKYVELIQRQQKGLFNNVCKSCDYYKSIYKDYTSYGRYNKKFMKLKDFIN